MVKKALLIISLVLVVALVFLTFAAYTPPILNSGSIAQLRAMEVHGARQHVLVRGKDRDNPIAFFLHGGPGMPAMYLAHASTRAMEADFTVVHWDQRGAGKSFNDNVAPESLTISQLLADAEYIIESLLEELDQDCVYLVGHSHGSYLAAILTTQRPDLVCAFIGTGQVSDRELSAQVRTQRLTDMGYDPETPGFANETMLFAAGGELYGETSFTPLIITGLLAPEYSLFDVLNVPKGSSFSSEHMQYDVIDGNLTDEITTFQRPVYFIMGKHDLVTPLESARVYFDSIDAPKKSFIVMDQSAHFPFFEEPEAFLHSLVTITGGTEAR